MPNTIKVKRDGPRGWHIIDRAKYDADPSAYVPFDEDGSGTAAPPANDVGNGGGDHLSDEQLRDAIKAATGKSPHHKLGRDKLIEQFDALNAGKPEPTASNGLTRREIEADLTAMEVEFGQDDALDDLVILRDLAREARA
jgi:hypothetical protein